MNPLRNSLITVFKTYLPEPKRMVDDVIKKIEEELSPIEVERCFQDAMFALPFALTTAKVQAEIFSQTPGIFLAVMLHKFKYRHLLKGKHSPWFDCLCNTYKISDDTKSQVLLAIVEQDSKKVKQRSSFITDILVATKLGHPNISSYAQNKVYRNPNITKEEILDGIYKDFIENELPEIYKIHFKTFYDRLQEEYNDKELLNSIVDSAIKLQRS